MSEIDNIVFEQYSWNQHNFGHSESQLFVTGQFDFVMGKSTISQRWQVIGMKAAGGIVSQIAQTMQMSQRTVYSLQKRHRENPGDVKDRPRSGRRCATTTAAGTFQEDAYYTPYYTLSSTIKISNVIE